MENICLLAGTVLTGKDLVPRTDTCILVSDGKIEKIISHAAFISGNYSTYAVHDLKNKTVLPGLIECHNHVGMDARLKNHLQMMNDSECELTVTALNTLREDLLSGVTTARCMGDRHYIDMKLRKEIESGRVCGPHLLCAGIGMRSLHGHGFVGLPHCGEAEFRRTSRENLLRGANLLKIFATSGTPSSAGEFIPHYLSCAEIRAVVEEAAGKNVPVAAHCIGGQALRDCLEEGVDIIEHAYSVTEADIDLLLTHNCWVVLTSGICLDVDREPFLSAESARIFSETRNEVAKNMEMLVKSGVPFALGTDANHGLLYREVEFAVGSGARTLDALKGVTSNAAKVCRIAHKTGSIAEGLDADLIAVEKNPLLIPSTLKNISFVMKKGNIYKNNI